MVWNGVAALSVGFGIWATHFVAMLAYKPGFALSYHFGYTAASLAIAILLCGAGITMAIHGKGKRDHFLGGAVVGVAISSMHYTGIAALVIGGEPSWNSTMVAASVLAGVVLGGLSFVVALGHGKRRMLGGMGLLTLAICGLHFTAMGAIDLSQCFPVVVDGEINGGWMAILLAFISLLILGAALGCAVLDEADRRRTARERERQLHDAQQLSRATRQLELAMTHMAQGLSLYDADGYLRLHNARLLQLLGLEEGRDLTGMTFRDICRLTIIGTGSVPDQIDSLTDQIVADHLPLIANGGEIVHSFPNDRTLCVAHSPVGDGSWVSTVDDISERQRSAAAIAHLARHDGLTGLPNRAMFEERFDVALAEAAEGDGYLAVVAMDLDRFKEVNDSFGHAAGDTVLKTLAKRLSECLKDGEVVARLGGDEFAALKSFTSMETLRDFLNRLEAALYTQVPVEGATLATGGSIGVAIYPEDGDERSKLLSNADLAMYRAKSEFDQRICYYEHEMDEHARERRSMTKDIWTALEQNAFHLVYQVQKSVSTNLVTGYEVLLRWDRPGYGLVSPADFIPIAEECGAITPIGSWVLRMACHDAASWPEPHKIAVNISGVQLGQLELIETVQDALLQSGLSPSRLELEVTETSIIADKQRALHILRQIKAMGVSVAIDDFGTGYSSLDTLRSFPFDKIKLDRSFIAEVEDNEQSKAIVRAILALGRSLHVPVLAEGVETLEQLEVLRNEGCNEAQGFLLGRPGTIDWSDLVRTARRA